MVIGSGGMAGHVIYNYLSDHGYNCVGIARNPIPRQRNFLLDVSNFCELDRLIQNESPDVVINAVGILIKGSKASISNAILMNSYFPHLLSDICKRYNSKLFHISTDCVFSGKLGGYKEDSFKDADDIYGRSKALGEVINEHDLTIRTSIIGPEIKDDGDGLFHWFMNTSGVARGFNNVFWSGVTTFELAKAIEELINSDITGLIHLTNNKKISKYELLVLLKEIWGRDDIDIIADFGPKHDKSLVSNRLPTDIRIPEYKEMLISMKNEMANDLMYTQYRAVDNL